MFRHRLHEHVGLTVRFNWFLLSFLAGNINAGGFLSSERFVSHVTGFATLAGIDMALDRWSDALAVVSIPLYFLGGVMLAGYFTDGRLEKGKQPLYPLIMGIISICLAIVTVGGMLNWFGDFGHTAVIHDDYFLLALLCGSCGLQNAAITAASGGTLRTTHLTGMTTDLGLGLIRGYYIRHDVGRLKHELEINARRVLSIISFVLGSAFAAVFFLKYGYAAFILPLAIAVYITIYSYYELKGKIPDKAPVEKRHISRSI